MTKVIAGLKWWPQAWKVIFLYPASWAMVLVFQIAFELGLSAVPVVGIGVSLLLREVMNAGFFTAYVSASENTEYSGKAAFAGFRRGRFLSLLGLGVISVCFLILEIFIIAAICFVAFGWDKYSLGEASIERLLPGVTLNDPLVLSLAILFWTMELLSDRLLALSTGFVTLGGHNAFSAVARAGSVMARSWAPMLGSLLPRFLLGVGLGLVIIIGWQMPEARIWITDSGVLMPLMIGLSVALGAFESWSAAVDAQYYLAYKSE